MGLFSIIAVLATTFLVCSDNSSAITTSKVTDPAFTANHQLFTNSQQTGIPKRLLRVYESNDNDDEDRVNLGTITSAIKSNTWKSKESAKVDLWLLRKTSMTNVWKSLQLGDDIQVILKNKKMWTLFEYVKKFNNGKPQSEQISVLRILANKYGEDVVMTALVSAKYADDTKDVVTKLETELFKVWIQKEDSVNLAFSTLKILDEGSPSTRIQKIGILENYITFFNAKTSNDENLVNLLIKGFRGDENLLSMLGVAKSDQLVGKKATELETEVLRKKLNKYIIGELDSVMSSKHLRRLDRYVASFSTKYGNTEISLLDALVAKYGDRAIAKSLVEAKSVEDTKEIATRLQTQQFQGWLKDGKSIDDVYELLHLNRYRDNTLTSRGLDVLDGFITFFNREKSAHESFIRVLSKNFGGDNKLAMKILEFKAHPFTKVKATELQNKLFQQWREEGLNSVTILSNVFNVNKKTATKEMIQVSKQFEVFLEKPSANNVANIVNPMRL